MIAERSPEARERQGKTGPLIHRRNCIIQQHNKEQKAKKYNINLMRKQTKPGSGSLNISMLHLYNGILLTHKKIIKQSHLPQHRWT